VKGSDVSAAYTDNLWNRPIPESDASRDKAALLELAARMHDTPGEILPKFVELAQELTGGISAGTSILEETVAGEQFRWHHLRGLLSPFEGATTPRDFSPCGITLDRNAPTLVRHPEHVYDWIPSHLDLPEVLLVPLYIGRSEPLGTLWIVADRAGHFHGGHAATMKELAMFIGIALKMLRTEQELHRALEQQELLAKEMSHRLKNVFAIVDGMIRISARGTDDKDGLVTILSGRLRALATAHSLVRRSFSDIHEAASDLAELLTIIVQPHEMAKPDGGRRFAFFGPPVLCGEQAINGLALVFHELATNAAKYGVLASERGGVKITWSVEDETLHVLWTEHDGPEGQTSPTSKGFGSSLIEATVVRQFGGTLDHEWRPEGLIVRLSIPISKLAR
jgi:two-component sensor histidine kinase